MISSPRSRARSHRRAGRLRPDRVTEDAAEWDYGDFEGLTSAEIGSSYPGWTIWTGPVPGGEDAGRGQRPADRCWPERGQADGTVLVFSHGHFSRCLAARWLAEPVDHGRYLRLGTGAVNSLGFEHGRPVILHWNVDDRSSSCKLTLMTSGRASRPDRR